MFRSGSEDAFRTIHDRYRPRLVAYTRQMLAGSSADAEDAVQEIFVRAYSGLRATHRELALRAWLYRVAHNRCIDELRRPQTVPTEEISPVAAGHGPDPVTQTEQRDALRRLIADVQRLPDQQRSALLMRELGGMTYADVSGALGVTVPAVKSLLVRARIGLAQASQARDTACAQIREDLIDSHDRGVRTSALARRHMRDCPGCRQFRSEVRGVSRQLAAFGPALGPIGVVAKLLGLGSAGGGGAAASSSAVAGGGAAAATGAAASAGALAGAGHVVSLLAAAVVTAGGALELQHVTHHLALRPPHRAAATFHHRVQAGPTGGAGGATSALPATSAPAGSATSTPATSAAGTSALPAASTTSTTATAKPKTHHHVRTSVPTLVEKVDPDLYYVNKVLGSASTTGSNTATAPVGGSPTAATTPGSGTSSTAASSTPPGTVPATGSAPSAPTSATGTGSTAPAPPVATSSPPPTQSTPPAPASGSSPSGPTAVGAGSSAGSASVASGTTHRGSSHRSGHGTHVGAVFVMTGS
jgi:RNA polymerase sigma factor (sigma-70 family)